MHHQTQERLAQLRECQPADESAWEESQAPKSGSPGIMFSARLERASNGISFHPG